MHGANSQLLSKILILLDRPRTDIHLTDNLTQVTFVEIFYFSIYTLKDTLLTLSQDRSTCCSPDCYIIWLPLLC